MRTLDLYERAFYWFKAELIVFFVALAIVFIIDILESDKKYLRYSGLIISFCLLLSSYLLFDKDLYLFMQKSHIQELNVFDEIGMYETIVFGVIAFSIIKISQFYKRIIDRPEILMCPLQIVILSFALVSICMESVAAVGLMRIKIPPTDLSSFSTFYSYVEIKMGIVFAFTTGFFIIKKRKIEALLSD